MDRRGRISYSNGPKLERKLSELVSSISRTSLRMRNAADFSTSRTQSGSFTRRLHLQWMHDIGA